MHSVNISTVNDDEGLMHSNLYLSNDRQINDIATKINEDYPNLFEVRAFNKASATEKDLISTKLIGKHNLYIDSFENFLTLDDLKDIETPDESSKTVIVANIGGFGNTLEQSIVSSSVFAKTIHTMIEMGLQPSADTYVDPCDQVASIVQNMAFSQPSSAILPISVYELNKYDVVFISDHDFANEVKLTTTNMNYQDIYVEQYGISAMGKSALNLLTVTDSVELEIKLVISELAEGKKTLFLPQFQGGKKAMERALELAYKNFPDYKIFTDISYKIETDILYSNITELLKSDFMYVCAAIKNVDLLITEPMFCVDISDAFNVPTIVIDNVGIEPSEYRYYSLVDVVNGFDISLSPNALAEEDLLNSSESMRKHIKSLTGKKNNISTGSVNNTNSPDDDNINHPTLFNNKYAPYLLSGGLISLFGLLYIFLK